MQGRVPRRVRRVGLVAGLIIVVAGCASSSTPSGRGIRDSAPHFASSGVVAVSGFPARNDAAVAWTGRALFVFGGYRNVGDTDRRELLRDGALVDVGTGEASSVPPAPFTAPLLFPAAARSGDVVAVAGVECADYRVEEDSDNYSCASGSGRFAMATFDAAGQRWGNALRLPASGAPRSSPPWARGRTVPGFGISQLLGTEPGRTVVVIARGDATDFWVHAPGSARLTGLPASGGSSNACSAGARVVVAAATSSPGLPTETSLRVLELGTPSAGWSETPATAVPVGFVPQLACLGTRVMVTDRFPVSGTVGRIFDLAANSWSDVAAPPPPDVTHRYGRAIPTLFYSAPEQRLWTGTELLELNLFTNPGGTLPPNRAYDPTSNAWRPLPPLPVPVFDEPQWAAPVVVAYKFVGPHARAQVVHYVPR